MDKKEKKAIRMKILDLLDNDPDNPEIQRLSKLLGEEDSFTPRTRKPKKTHFHTDPEKYIELRLAGKRMKEIAEYFGISYKELKNEITILMKREIIPKGVIPRGIGNLLNRMTKEEYLAKKEQGLTDEAIAKELGLSKTAFTTKRKEWGIEFKKKKERNIITEQEYREMKYQLMTDYQIVKEKGMHHKTLLQYKRIWGVI
jgi:DNA-binding CsgD family transcriptional regulator